MIKTDLVKAIVHKMCGAMQDQLRDNGKETIG